MKTEQKQYMIKIIICSFTVTSDFFVDAEEKKQVLNNPVMDRANRLCKMEASNGRRTFGTENERNR